MTYDTTPLERDCVLLNCSQPAVDPGHGRVHCATHDPDPPQPTPPTPPTPPAAINQDPTPTPPPPDPTAMEPTWNGSEWVLRPRQPTGPHVDRQELLDVAQSLTAALTAIERWLR